MVLHWSYREFKVKSLPHGIILHVQRCTSQKITFVAPWHYATEVGVPAKIIKIS